jgi:hypothetical protein
MRGQGEEFQRQDDESQRGWWRRHAESVALLVAFLVVALISSPLVNAIAPGHESPQWQLVYGAATYVLAIIAAMLFEMVTKIQVTPLRVVLGTLVLGLTFVPPLPGSMLVVAGVSSLAGYHMVRYEVVLGLLLYVVAMSFPLYWLRGRTATRG